MSEPSITLDAPAETVTFTHGGAEGTQLRAVVLDDDVVTSVVLLPADWAEQAPATRWAPGPGLAVVVLEHDDDAALAVPGARRIDGAWVAPLPVAEGVVDEPAPADDLSALVDALRALTPDQAEQLQQLLAAPSGG